MRRESERYHGAAMTIHWVTAVFVLGLIATGLVMGAALPGDAAAAGILPLHASFGLSVLALTVARIVLRFTVRPPPLPKALPAWERFAAQALHGLFYVLLILIPMSGWVVVSVAANPPSLPWFGAFGEMPRLPPPPDGQGQMVAERVMSTHRTLAYVLIGLLAVHIAAALRHLLFLRDGVMARMVPAGRRP
jgi:cytochrome b561